MQCRDIQICSVWEHSTYLLPLVGVVYAVLLLPPPHRHAGIPSRHLTSSAGVLHPLISLPHYSHPHQRDGDTRSRKLDIVCSCDNVESLSCSLTVLATGEEQCKRIEDTFTEFSKQLRALKGLPLAITSVQGASPVFCHSSVFPQLPWNGRTPRKMLGTPPANSQSGCLYPSCDFATPPFVPALEGENA